VVITVGIGVGLLRSKTGWAHTDKARRLGCALTQIVNRLVRINLESQVPATVMAMAFLIIFSASAPPRRSRPVLKPRSLLNFVWQGIQSKFYLIGLLYTLNSRVSFEVRHISVFKPTSRDLGGITVDVQTETYEEQGDGPVRSIGEGPAENETIPLDRMDSVPYERYGSSTSIARRRPATPERKRSGRSGADHTSPGGKTDDTLVGEYVYKQRDWED
jgi:hypothetical protein